MILPQQFPGMFKSIWGYINRFASGRMAPLMYVIFFIQFIQNAECISFPSVIIFPSEKRSVSENFDRYNNINVSSSMACLGSTSDIGNAYDSSFMEIILSAFYDFDFSVNPTFSAIKYSHTRCDYRQSYMRITGVQQLSSSLLLF